MLKGHYNYAKPTDDALCCAAQPMFRVSASSRSTTQILYFLGPMLAQFGFMYAGLAVFRLVSVEMAHKDQEHHAHHASQQATYGAVYMPVPVPATGAVTHGGGYIPTTTAGAGPDASGVTVQKGWFA